MGNPVIVSEPSIVCELTADGFKGERVSDVSIVKVNAHIPDDSFHGPDGHPGNTATVLEARTLGDGHYYGTLIGTGVNTQPPTPYSLEGQGAKIANKCADALGVRGFDNLQKYAP